MFWQQSDATANKDQEEKILFVNQNISRQIFFLSLIDRNNPFSAYNVHDMQITCDVD